jgi:glycosyltransferase involved in cell wall biosynthesis
MPIYNGIEFIDESVSSILNQTYDKWELLIGINGHSKDSEVYEIAKKFELNNDKIRVFDFYEIKGKSNTLNEMIQYCNYPYIGLLDVDDIWECTKLEIQSHYFLNDYDIIGSNCIYFGDINNVVPYIPVGDISNYDFKLGNPIINSSSIIKKDLCHWNENGIEDYDLWLNLRSQNRRFFNCNQVLVRHRIHSTSAFNSKGHGDKIQELLSNY